MASKRYFNTEEALKIILEPNYDSELSDLSEDENEDATQVTVHPRIRNESESENEELQNQNKEEEKDEGEKEEEVIEQLDNDIVVEPFSEEVSSDDEENKMDISKFEKIQPRWRKKNTAKRKLSIPWRRIQPST